ncbi:hypothetical protein MFRU_003g04410 [Monilinia fructicola]|nr:hypothetical protein MFRU_003g04410 [Monilinia fructicola]
MPFIGAFGQAFGFSTTLTASNATSSHPTKSSNTISNQDSLVDGTKDIELGNLPTTNPTAVESGPANNSTPCDKLHRATKSMKRTGFLKFMKTILLTMLLSLAILIPIDLLPIWTNELDWVFALATQNIGVINGTVDYGNGTIVPLDNFHLDGSNLTLSTCNYITPENLCTNNSHHLTDIRIVGDMVFTFLLTFSLFFVIAVGNGIAKFRPGMLDREDRPSYFLTRWPRGRSTTQ